jgi:hypothetical protein
LGEFLSIPIVARLVACFALASLFTLPGGAQQTATPFDPDSSTQAQPQSPTKDQATSSSQSTADQDKKDQDKKDDKAGKEKDKDKKKTEATGQSQGKTAGTSNDRLFYTLPNFLSIENTAQLPPLTAKQKFGVVARGTFDPVQYPWWAFLSALSQADNSEPGYGQGWAAYGKRFGTAAADGIIENFMTAAVLPSLLHQDPRFFQSSKGGYTRRTFYAVSRIFVTRTDSGHSQFNYSEIVGSALSASISTYSYHPRSTYISTPTNPHMFVPSDRTLKNTASVWGSQISYDTITIAVKEFWPDIHRALAKKPKIEPVATP